MAHVDSDSLESVPKPPTKRPRLDQPSTHPPAPSTKRPLEVDSETENGPGRKQLDLDTAGQLRAVAVQQTFGRELQCLPWKLNSCWFDSSVMLILVMMYRDKRSFLDFFGDIDPALPLGRLFRFLSDAFCIIFSASPPSSVPAKLEALRADFRNYLESTSTEKSREWMAVSFNRDPASSTVCSCCSMGTWLIMV